MGTATTHTEGRVVTHSTDDAGSIDVVQLPNRDAALQDVTATHTPTTKTPTAAKPTPAVKAATTQKAARIKKATTKR